MKIKLIISTCLVALIISGCTPSIKTPVTSKVIINDNVWRVEEVTTKAAQTTGLSRRRFIPPNTGMLFTFATSSNRSFWMKNMLFSLDIVWINQGKIVKIHHNLAPEGENPIAHYSANQPVDQVLEINANEARINQLKVGDVITYQ